LRAAAEREILKRQSMMARNVTRPRETFAYQPLQPALGSNQGGNVRHTPLDNQAYRFPVSVKGVIIRAGKVVLLKNERDEWELPGGKLEPSESPEFCVAREINEELGLQVHATALLDTWVYELTRKVRVLIVTYGCAETAELEAVLSHEHKQLQWFPVSEVAELRMPRGYKTSISNWIEALRASPNEPLQPRQ